MNHDLVQRVKSWIREDSTDIIFTCLSGELVTPDTVRNIAESGVPILNMCLNDKQAFIGRIKGTCCVKGRDFELLMSSGFYLTEYHPELENFFDLENEIVAYTGFVDIVSKIRYLLSNPEKADEIW